MSAKLMILCAVVAFLLLGGAAAGLLLTGGTVSRAPAPRSPELATDNAPQVRAACVTSTPPSTQPPKEEPRAERFDPDPKLLSRLPQDLAALSARQEEVRDLTEDLAVDSGLVQRAGQQAAGLPRESG